MRSRLQNWKQAILVGTILVLAAAPSIAESVTVTGRTRLERSSKTVTTGDAGNVVVWLSPLGSAVAIDPDSDRWPSHPRLTQRNKRFEPHVLIVPVGASVEFPNHDPFFHNVFSLFDGKRFDLGLYEAGTTRDVRFDKPGISYIFCNIHSDMSAVVIALDTPYFAVSNARGDISIPDVPPGRYMMHVWTENSLPDVLQTKVREVTIGAANASLGIISLPESQIGLTHTNKYGQEYEPPSPSSPVYAHP
jgi:plastocyanin